MDNAALAAKFGLSLEEAQYELAHLDESKRPTILAALGSCSALATLSIMLRIFVRWRNKNEFKTDDYTVFIAFILSWGEFAAFYYQTRYGGLGMHILAFTPKMEHTFNIAFYINIATCCLIGMFNQLSFLFLYKRVFTVYREWFRNGLYGIAILSLTSNLSCLFAGLFQCMPIYKAWEKLVPGHCINIRSLLVAHAALSLVIDVAIVVVPVPILWPLHASLSYRTAICGMFMLGALVCIINVIKIHYLVPMPTGDVTYKNLGSSIWSHAQSCLGIVGASLPFLISLFRTLHDAFHIKSSSSTAITTSKGRSARSSKSTAVDSYKMLHGKEPSLTESDMPLVPPQQWIGTPTFPDRNSTARTKSVIEAGGRNKNLERNLSLTEIAVTQDFEVSSSIAE